ncbi:hypothetical protein M3Y97_00801100 [Aphelenchoides bicaudatus]|nr:hypothetical protein M3Y97_00801100 [Aphelenchoides bicaudatus]
MRLENGKVFGEEANGPLNLLKPTLQRASTSDDSDLSAKQGDVMLNLGRAESQSTATDEEPPESPSSAAPPKAPFKKSDSSNSLFGNAIYGEEEEITFPKTICWDWSFCQEGVARGAFLADRFFICLPFNNGGTGETNGSTKKFERINECNYSWTIGLSNSGEFGTSFWRLELEVIRQLNLIVLIVSRDISTKDSHKRLKRVRKVYKLPDYYDVRTLKTKSYDWAVILEAEPRKRHKNRPVRLLRRSDTMT